MSTRTPEEYLANAATTTALVEAGVEMMRQNIKRRFPDASKAKLDELLCAWLYREDDPVPGDTAGAVRRRTP